jgi:phosphoribosylformimino-5-aminoimidazole carboxamide ribotide isomerase
MLTGPDIRGLADAAASTSIPVIASGGVGSLAHLAELSAVAGLNGVIVGKAIYEGKFTVAEAVRELS